MAHPAAGRTRARPDRRGEGPLRAPHPAARRRPRGAAPAQNARVLVVGAGGLGSPALLYLAAAGVGTIGIVDDDTVDASNLQRQVIHGTPDVGRPKTESAAEAVAGINPLVEVVRHDLRLNATNALEHDRRLRHRPRRHRQLPDALPRQRRLRAAGQTARVGLDLPLRRAGHRVVRGHGPCYRCVFPDPPPPDSVPSCATGGVLGVLCAAIGSVQVAETIKLIVGQGDPLVGRILVHDSLRQSWDTLRGQARTRPARSAATTPPSTSSSTTRRSAAFRRARSRPPLLRPARRRSARSRRASWRTSSAPGPRRGVLRAGGRPRRGRARRGRDPGRSRHPPRGVPLRNGPGKAARGHTGGGALQVRGPVGGGRAAAVGGRGVPACATSAVGCWPGSTTSTRPCRCTDVVARGPRAPGCPASSPTTSSTWWTRSPRAW